MRSGGGTILASYTYDALDRLRDVTAGGTTVRHRYVGMTTQLAQLWNVTSGASDRDVIRSLAGIPLGDQKPGVSGRRFYGANAHGDIVWSAAGGGAVNATRRFDPWGEAIGSSGTLGDLRFQGDWRDPATGLTWVVTRWYAPALGTFLSEDALLGEPANPDTRHLRAYGLGDPVRHWDPDGRQAIGGRGVGTCGSATFVAQPRANGRVAYYVRISTNVGGPILSGRLSVVWFNSTRLRAGSEVVYHRNVWGVGIDSHWNIDRRVLATGRGRVGLSWAVSLTAGLSMFRPAYCYGGGYRQVNVP